ncbi:MAG TPA: 50S ribosomal protein L13 [Candidatus Andersenbacteria bacterium]|nr:50S ribosomal protein L13 [Candidatus Andersenbacteria bacterium]
MAIQYTSANLEWHVIDAKSGTLGRLATKVASLLLAKHRTDSEKHVAAPVRVIVINSDDLKVTGKKKKQKMYRRYTGYPGGLRERTLQEQMGKDSRFVIEQAVIGMLPKNRLRASRMRNLYVYPTAEHPHLAQVKGEQV